MLMNRQILTAKGLCADDLRVQKGIADLLHSLAGLIRCISMCLFAYTVKMIITAVGKTITPASPSSGSHKKKNKRAASSGSHAYEAIASSQESGKEEKRS